MKSTRVSSKRMLKALPGQLDLFETQSGSVALARSDMLKKETVRSRKSNKPPKTASSRKSGPNKVLKTAAPSLNLVDTQTAAEKLGLGVSTLEKMRLQRRGPPFVKLARNTVRYRLSDLEKWVSDQVRC